MIIPDLKDEILSLHSQGLGSGRIAKELRKKYGVEFNDRRIRTHLAKWKELDTFEDTLHNNKFDPPENWSHGWLKTKEASIFIKNTKEEVPLEVIRDDFIKEMKSHAPTYTKVKRDKIKDPHLLVIDIADLHIGKLSSPTETSSEYNSDIAVSRAIDGVMGILSKAQGYPIDQILFVIGNDILHIDNAVKTTTRGTPQDVSGMWYDNFRIAREMYVKVIEVLVNNCADVHVVHNPSNHDYVTGYMLADSVCSWFHKHKNVTFDVDMIHRKVYQYGTNMIGTSHGDGAKLNELPLLLAHEYPEIWAKTKWRYIYLHHLHHKKQFKFMVGEDFSGVTVEYLRSPSSADSWHYRNGYVGCKKAVEGFIHHKEDGQIARLTHLF